MKTEELNHLIQKKSSLVLQLEIARKTSRGNITALASEAAWLEGMIADAHLKGRRRDKATANMISQASCLVDAGKTGDALAVLAEAHQIAPTGKLRAWIDSEVERLAKLERGPSIQEARDLRYDVFLSHSAKDKPAVRALAERLKRDGLRLWFDEWEMRPGDMIGKRIEEGLEASRVLVLCMSRDAFASDWATLESGTFRFRDPTNRERRFIPLRLDDAEMPQTLKQFAFVDWRKKSRREYARLVNMCQTQKGESKRHRSAGLEHASPESIIRLPVAKLAEQTQRANEARSVKDAMGAVLQVPKPAGFCGGLISRVFEVGDRSFVVAEEAVGTQWQAEILPRTRRALHGNDVLAKACRSKCSIYVRDAAAEKSCDQATARTGQVVSFSAVPLLDQEGQPIGVLQVDLGDTRDNKTLPTNTFEVLNAIGAVASTALSRAIQSEELQITRKLDAALLECRGCKSVEEAVGTFVKRAVEALGADGGHVRLLSEGGDVLRLVGGCGEYYEEARKSRFEVGLDDFGPSSLSLNAKRNIAVNETSVDPRFRQFTDAIVKSTVSSALKRISSHATYVIAPDEGNPIGVLAIVSAKPWFFGQSQFRSLHDIGRRLFLLIDYLKRQASGMSRMLSVRVFYAYAREDEKLREHLERHLATLKRLGVIEGWHDRRISAGQDWKQEINEHLETAQIILLLISPSFLASDYCCEIEMKRALERHQSREAHVIPIILRPVDWRSQPFAKLQMLPTDAKPVTTWANKDRAFQDVAAGIYRVVEELGLTAVKEKQASIGPKP